MLSCHQLFSETSCPNTTMLIYHTECILISFKKYLGSKDLKTSCILAHPILDYTPLPSSAVLIKYACIIFQRPHPQCNLFVLLSGGRPTVMVNYEILQSKNVFGQIFPLFTTSLQEICLIGGEFLYTN